MIQHARLAIGQRIFRHRFLLPSHLSRPAIAQQRIPKLPFSTSTNSPHPPRPLEDLAPKITPVYYVIGCVSFAVGLAWWKSFFSPGDEPLPHTDFYEWAKEVDEWTTLNDSHFNDQRLSSDERKSVARAWEAWKSAEVVKTPTYVEVGAHDPVTLTKLRQALVAMAVVLKNPAVLPRSHPPITVSSLPNIMEFISNLDSPINRALFGFVAQLSLLLGDNESLQFAAAVLKRSIMTTMDSKDPLREAQLYMMLGDARAKLGEEDCVVYWRDGARALGLPSLFFERATLRFVPRETKSTPTWPSILSMCLLR